MRTFTQKQITEAYNRLPEQVKDAIFAEATADKIQAIGKKHGLLLDKMGNLAEEVGYVMLGLIPSKEFPEYIIRTCEISAEKASTIIADLNEQIFLPIQEHIFSTPKEKQTEKVAPERAFDAKPSPTFRPSSFAMPIQESGVKSSTNQPSVAPMIFPQKLRAEEQPPIQDTLPQTQSSIVPKAPEFREVVRDAKKLAAPSTTNDAYREPIL